MPPNMTNDQHLARRLEHFAEACRREGIKATHQRMEIMREMAVATDHPDAESIYEKVKRRVPSISLDTVYRTLHLLEDRGVIARVLAPGDRARYDANRERHHHFVCTSCGSIEDFRSPDLDGIEPPREAKSLGAVQSVYVEVRGLCRRCSARL
jgi:Fur family transcriptional regulator, peroxide stress response regulator